MIAKMPKDSARSKPRQSPVAPPWLVPVEEEGKGQRPGLARVDCRGDDSRLLQMPPPSSTDPHDLLARFQPWPGPRAGCGESQTSLAQVMRAVTSNGHTDRAWDAR